MDPKQLFFDERFKGFCVYCGGPGETRDHVPSRILLDDPLPNQLPVVSCCKRCNNDFSLDEEYFACFIEAILCGSAEVERISRPKIVRSLQRNASLMNRIQSSRIIDEDSSISFRPELDRVRKIVLKLARGHAAYELSLPQLEEPMNVRIIPLQAMSDTEREEFECPGAGMQLPWPEIGSRAFIRAVMAAENSDVTDSWVVVQVNRYRYIALQDGGVLVRIVISEYLACDIYWE